MVDRREKLTSYMRSMGVIEILVSTQTHFPRKVETEFGNLLQFEDLLDDRKLFVLLKNLSKAQLAEDVVMLSQKVNNRNSPSRLRKFSKLASINQSINHFI